MLYIGLFARFGFVLPEHSVWMLSGGIAFIGVGAVLWWFGITFFVNKVRKKFNLRGIWILNRIIGSIVMLVSAVGLVYTLLGESIY